MVKGCQVIACLFLSLFVACSTPTISATSPDAAAPDSSVDSTVDATVMVDAAPDAVVLPDVCPSSLADPTGVHEVAPVLIPTGAMPPNGWRLVIAMHAYGGSNKDAVWRTGLEDLEKDSVVITPNGLVDVYGYRYFYANTECCNLHNDPGPTDTEWLLGLIKTMKASCKIDANQVFAIGTSNGGFMAEQMACDSDEIVGVVSESDAPPVHCNRPIVLRKAHGTADPRVAYTGGMLWHQTQFPAADDPTPYGCTGFISDGAQAKDYDEYVTGAESERLVATGCPAGEDIELIRMTGSAHAALWLKEWKTDTLAWVTAHARIP